MAKAKILGKLRGPIASAKEPSRNGRRYEEGFWDAKFNSDLFQEGLKNKVLFGCLYHPEGDAYEQIHADDTAAVVLTDVKKKELEYEGTFEILPTQSGQCLRNLLDIGCVFGVSSRGLADSDYTVYDESVADSYDLITWDIVALPGVKSCRLHEISAVAESIKHINKSKIMESLNSIASENKYLAEYIDKAIKTKEDFDEDLQIEDTNYLFKYNLPPDLEKYANIVEVDEKGVPYYDDGEHGKHKVRTQGVMNTVSFKPGDIYLVDNIYWVKSKGFYSASGDWVLI